MNTISQVSKEFEILRNDVLSNILKLYNNVKIDQKTNILSLVAYEKIKPVLRNIGFKFNNTTFKNAISKRESNHFTLDTHLRSVPPSKKPLNLIEKNSIIRLLQQNSKESGRNQDINYLNTNKKEIYREYLNENTRPIAYNTFLKYIPKTYKFAKRRTDVCGICSIGVKLKNLGQRSLSGSELDAFNKDLAIYNDHRFVAQTQKEFYHQCIDRLTDQSCVIVMDFKQNLVCTYGGDETSYDFYNNRQISVLGIAIIFLDNGVKTTSYVNVLSKVLSHDSLFSGDALECVFGLIGDRFKHIYGLWATLSKFRVYVEMQLSI